MENVSVALEVPRSAVLTVRILKFWIKVKKELYYAQLICVFAFA